MFAPTVYQPIVTSAVLLVLTFGMYMMCGAIESAIKWLKDFVKEYSLLFRHEMNGK